MYTNNRDAYRQTFYVVWQKYKAGLSLTTIEQQLITVILDHPEYHSLLEKPAQSQEFLLEENPFFHLSLHLALQDQLRMNKPLGIQEIYDSLLKKHYDVHDTHHLMMNCLTQTLWDAQNTDGNPSEEHYLQLLQNLLNE